MPHESRVLRSGLAYGDTEPGKGYNNVITSLHRGGNEFGDECDSLLSIDMACSTSAWGFQGSTFQRAYPG